MDLERLTFIDLVNPNWIMLNPERPLRVKDETIGTTIRIGKPVIHRPSNNSMYKGLESDVGSMLMSAAMRPSTGSVETIRIEDR